MFSVQGKDASKLAGNWFQLLTVLFIKQYLSTSVVCFLVIKKAEFMARTISDMLSVNSLKNLLFITTDLIQFHQHYQANA